MIERNKGRIRELFRAYTIKAHENALQLIKDAELLFTNQSYDHCYALLVLAFEEWAKSIIGFELHIGLRKIDDLEIQEILKNHRIKHAVGLTSFFLYLFTSYLDNSKNMDRVVKLYEEYFKGVISEKRAEERLKRLISQETSPIAETIMLFIEIIDEWNRNDMMIERKKQLGFYVDYDMKDFSTSSPQEKFSKLKVQENIQTYKMIIESTQELIQALKDRDRQNKYIKPFYQLSELFS